MTATRSWMGTATTETPRSTLARQNIATALTTTAMTSSMRAAPWTLFYGADSDSDGFGNPALHQFDRCYENDAIAAAYQGNLASCSGYRLPTEAEWEYAARSGTAEDFWTADGGGASSESGCASTILDGVGEPLLSDYAWFCGVSTGSVAVAQKLPNGFGLFDIHGNLWELTEFKGGFPASGIDPNGPSSSSYVTIKRGCYGESSCNAMLSARGNAFPYQGYSTVGLACQDGSLIVSIAALP
jgi:hypothetical protein